MAELKTKPNDASVEAFLQGVEMEQKRADCLKISAWMEQITGEKLKMWGNSIIGFGKYKFQYESGRSGEWFLTGFSPRKASITLYLIGGLSHHEDLLAQLGKHKRGKGCLYIKKLSDIDPDILKQMIESGVQKLKENN